MSRAINEVGNTYHRWTVIYRAPDKGYKVYWWCRCLCGTERAVKSSNLRNGQSKSCGCLARELSSIRKYGRSHGLSYHELYDTWVAMKQRCLNKKHPSYKDYGGRGIAICERWLNSFPNFLEDMGERPEGLTLERVNNDLGYSPENCIWATWKEQQNNRRPYKPRKP